MVAEPQLWCLAPHPFHGGAESPLELVVVVGIEQVVFAVVLVVEHHLHAGEAMLQPRAIPVDPQVAPLAVGTAQSLVAPAAPVEKRLGQVGTALPLAAVDQPLQTRPIGPRCGAVHPPGVSVLAVGRRQWVLRLGFAAGGHQGRGPVEPGHQLRKRIAKQPGNAQGHIHPRSTQAGDWDQFQVHQAAAGPIPHRSHPQQGQGLGDVFPAIAHGAGAPHGEGQAAQRFPLVHQMLVQQQLGAAATEVPGGLGGQAPQIHAVEIAPGGQEIGPAPGGGSGGAGGDASTAEGREEAAAFRLPAAQQVGHQRGPEALEYRLGVGPGTGSGGLTSQQRRQQRQG